MKEIFKTVSTDETGKNNYYINEILTDIEKEYIFIEDDKLCITLLGSETWTKFATLIDTHCIDDEMYYILRDFMFRDVTMYSNKFFDTDFKEINLI